MAAQKKLLPCIEVPASPPRVCAACSLQQVYDVLAAPLESNRVLISWKRASLVQNRGVCALCRFILDAIDAGSGIECPTNIGEDVHVLADNFTAFDTSYALRLLWGPVDARKSINMYPAHASIIYLRPMFALWGSYRDTGKHATIESLGTAFAASSPF